MNLDHRVETLKGVGKLAASKLAKLGINTLADLLAHYPRRYDDFSDILPISAIRPGPVTLSGRVERIASRRARNRRLSITEAIISDNTGTIKAIWFNQPYLARSFPPGTQVFISGKLEFKNNDLALQSPAIELAGGGGGGATANSLRHTGRIVSIYPETDGVSSKQLRNLIMPLLPLISDLPETLPSSVATAAKLMPRGRALMEIHAPSSQQNLENARHRIAFEELFYIIAATLVIKQEVKVESAPSISLNIPIAQAVTAALDFDLTNAQRAAAWQILQDMTEQRPMNRLLEGDVGSGKTIVAVLAAAMAIASGYQVALMVPTDILARQHYAKIQPLLAKLGYNTQLLLARQTARDKREVLEAIASGRAQLVLGTHSLLSQTVSFHQLGLVIIDEQHRFGVSQRASLKEKAGYLPHLLTMTATPIPRSLALTVYGDLDVSVIDQLPPGRKPVATKVLATKDRSAAYQFMDTQLASGRQMFVVCPLIDDSPALEVKSATAELARLQQGPFAHRRIGLVHGKLKPDVRDAVMQQFSVGELDILVATTVIEVGIDMPNASIMLIEAAERFGLATLHQLRGRVGRGQNHSYCFLASDSAVPGAMQRLQALERTQDGFRLAQVDMELRGPGQVYGLRQHGILDLGMADLGDTKLISAVRKYAAAFVQDQPAMLKYPQIVQRINQLKTVTSLD